MTITRSITFSPGPFEAILSASGKGRLANFVVDIESEPMSLFTAESRKFATSGEWYGEHVGKWLVAASNRAQWSGDPAWVERIENVAAEVLAHQEPTGYLGTYCDQGGGRFTDPDAAGKRTWDLWVHAWMLLGLIHATRVSGRMEFVDAALVAGELIVQTFRDDPSRLLEYGNHKGLSAIVIIEPLAELTALTGDPSFAEFAYDVVLAAEAKLKLLSAETPVAIGSGKIYQLLWVMVGLLALEPIVSDPRLSIQVARMWDVIHNSHLTPTGGPWGGIATHKEVFNPAGYFSPDGMVETCSTESWMRLSRKLYELTRERRYRDAFEQSAMNALLGAADPNGNDWIYFTFPNGTRNNTYFWACCKSSGMMAIEHAADFAVSDREDSIEINLLVGMCVRIEEDEFEVEWAEDFSAVSIVRLAGERPIRLRLPDWLGGEELLMPKDQNSIRRTFQPLPRIESKNFTVEHHGTPIVSEDFLCLHYGPYSYATGLIDGYKRHESLKIAWLNAPDFFRREAGTDRIFLTMPGRTPILFEPYYRAGGQHHGAWRRTWIEVEWQ